MAPLTGSSSSRARLQQEWGIVFDYPNLSLHSAAANDNLGLVKYALSNGQPANSVLNGVLPIHAAAAGGHEDVARMLIENGANVDAPRLPRKYMTDKTRTGTFTLGTAGSTPLHFAAANGHIGVIELLLACGAKPDKVEKLGKTPEQLALEQGHREAAQLLRTAAHNYREGALGGSDDEDARSTTSSSRLGSRAKSPMSRGLSNRFGQSPSTASLRSVATTQSALPPSTRRLLAPRRSSESLAAQAASAIKERMGRTASLRQAHQASERLSRQASEQSGLAAPPSVRRPSLPAMFDRHSKPGQAIRNALSSNASSTPLSRPPPLNLLSESNLDSARYRRGSGSSRSLANVFTRQNSLPQDDDDTSTIGSPTTLFSPISEDGDYSLPQALIDDNEGLAGPLQTQTAPANQSSFPANAQAGPSSSGLSHSASTGNLSGHYRPRKSSTLAANGPVGLTSSDIAKPKTAPDQQTEQSAEGEGPSPGSSSHRRTSSSASQKAKTFFGKLSRTSSSRSSFSNGTKPSSPTLEAEQPRLSLPEAEVADDPDAPGEANDRFDDMPASLARIVGGRSRGDSVGSASSSRSYAPSPLAGDHLHPADGIERPSIRTRPHRSGSAATDPDLRQVVLGNTMLGTSSANASVLSGSPGSASSVEPFSAHSTHSTAPSSAIWSNTSTRSPKGKTSPGPPRTPTGELITPAQASSMVKLAEQQLLSFSTNSADSAGKPSLSEQLAAYGESLALERQVKKAALHRPPTTAAPMPYSWEKLGKDGTRTPVSRSERRAGQPSTLTLNRGPGSSFQQGPLDRRRTPAPTLRQDFKTRNGDSLSDVGHPYHHTHPHSSLRYEMAAQTPRAEPRGDPLAGMTSRTYHQKADSAKEGSQYSPDSSLLAPPRSAVDARGRRKSADRRSHTPDTGSVSSHLDSPRSPPPAAAAALLPPGQKLRPVRSRPHDIKAEADELQLERTHSINAMQEATPIAVSTVDGHNRDGKLKRLVGLFGKK